MHVRVYLNGLSNSKRGSRRLTDQLNAKSIVTLVAGTYVARFLSLGLSFVSNILLAQLLGPDGKGIIATSVFWSGFLASILALGLDSTAIYFIGQAPGRFHKLTRIFLGYSLVAMFVGALSLFVIDQGSSLFQGRKYAFWGTIGLTLTTLVTNFFYVLYIGIGKLSFVNRMSVLGASLYLVLLVGAFQLQIINSQWILVGIVCLQFVTSAYLVLRAFANRLPREATDIPWRDYGRYAIKVYAGNLAGILHGRVSFMILSLSASMTQIGVYSIAQLFSEVVLILPTALINITLPQVAALSRQQAIARVSEINRFAVVLTLAVTLGVSAAATILIPVALGAAFLPATRIVWLLCPGVWAAAVGMVLSIYFNGVGKPEVPSSASWIGFMIAAPLTVLLAPGRGGDGAAIAVSISRIIVASYMLLLYIRSSGEKLADVVLIQAADWQRGRQLIKELRL